MVKYIISIRLPAGDRARPKYARPVNPRRANLLMGPVGAEALRIILCHEVYEANDEIEMKLKT
jgi:hypothetical protein